VQLTPQFASQLAGSQLAGAQLVPQLAGAQLAPQLAGAQLAPQLVYPSSSGSAFSSLGRVSAPPGFSPLIPIPAGQSIESLIAQVQAQAEQQARAQAQLQAQTQLLQAIQSQQLTSGMISMPLQTTTGNTREGDSDYDDDDSEVEEEEAAMILERVRTKAEKKYHPASRGASSERPPQKKTKGPLYRKDVDASLNPSAVLEKSKATTDSGR